MPRSQAIKPVRPDSLSKQVGDMLREAIFSGQFQPGEPLRELHLAKLFAVSQATIREALVQLEQAGLVIREKNRKTTVTTFTIQEIRQRLSIRIVLEEQAFLEAAARMDESDFKKLTGYAQSLERAIERGNWKEVTMSDIRFHHFVWSRCGNPVLERMLDQLTTPLFAFMGRQHERASVSPASGRPHEALVDVLRSKVEADIRSAVRGHVESSYTSMTGWPKDAAPDDKADQATA